jgi:hypothetical protein
MAFSQSKFIRFQNGMRRRIESLRPKAEESLELAVDTMMQERVDSFFRVEQGLEEVIKSLTQIEEEIPEIRDLSGAMRLESRLEFVEDRWDDFDSGVEFGSSLADVTASFRHKAKQLHPDSNNGDRSAEPELRRMLEAYQFLKEYLSLSNVEPPRSPDATYRPTE